MKSHAIGYVMIMMALAAFGAEETETESKTAEDAGVELFNGVDLTGWKIQGTEKWYVSDGLLVCETGPDRKYGYLVTEKIYKDVEITVEFKQGSNGNSGLFFRTRFDEETGKMIRGWQAEIAPPGHDTGGIYESYGRGWLKKPSRSKDEVLKFGQWNTMKVRAQGGHITTWLNGTQMIDLTDEKLAQAEGNIALQIHAGDDVKVTWRHIRVKKL